MSDYGPDYTSYPMFYEEGLKQAYTHTAPFLTTPKLTKIEQKRFMPTYGLEALNKMVLYQDKIWVTSTGRVKAIEDLSDTHLERIICWLEAGRNWLLEHRSVRVGMTPMYARLLKERQARWRRKQKQKEEWAADKKEEWLERLADILRSNGYTVAKT